MCLPENPVPLSSPRSVEGLDLWHPLLSELLPDVAIVRFGEVFAVCLALGKETNHQWTMSLRQDPMTTKR